VSFAHWPGKESPPSASRNTPTIPVVLLAVVACFWIPSQSSAAGPQNSSPVLAFDLAPNQDNGLLDPGLPFDFSVRLKGIKPRRDEELVAVFESLAYPHRLVAFVPEEASTDLVASTRFESRPIAAGAGQPLRMEVVVARLRGMRLETVFSRATYLTTVPAASAPSAPASGTQAAPAHGTALLEALLEEAPATDRSGRPVEPILPPEQIVVEDLAGGSRAVPGPVYWKSVSDSVARHWQQRRAQLRKDRAARSLRVQFRLYPQGFAQLIQVERSSGDPIVDEAGLHTVLSLHPFPPFPPDVRDPSVDVHVDLPGAKR
jgi:TonB family protein